MSRPEQRTPKFVPTGKVRRWSGVRPTVASHRLHYIYLANHMSKNELLEAVIKLQSGDRTKWDDLKLSVYKKVAGIKGNLRRV